MSNKIYIGNMSYSINDDSLAEIFSEFGDVLSSKVVIDQFTGRSKGFGFIEMGDEEAKNAAISALNGKEVQGRQLKVNEAFDKPRRSERF